MQIEQKQAEEAVRTLLRWIGENPDSDALNRVPKQVVERLAKHFAGWQQDPVALLKASLCDVDNKNAGLGMIIFPKIKFDFYCAHVLTLTSGSVRIAYMPQDHIVGISAMERLVTLLSKRLQLQEYFTQQIGDAVKEALVPCGVAVAVMAKHHCADGAALITHYYSGVFEQDPALRREFLS